MITEVSNKTMAYSVKEVVEQTRLSDAFIRLEIRRGKLKAKKFGARVLVLASDLDEYLNNASDWGSPKSEFHNQNKGAAK